MIAKSCIVCAHDITGRWPAQVCSMLCRAIAQRRKRARKPAAYFQRREMRARQRKTGKRAARRALRRLVAARKRLAKLLCRLERVKGRAVRTGARKLGNLSARLRRQRNLFYEFAPRSRQRERQSTRQYRLQARQRERARASREMGIIYTLRDLGWLRGYDIVRPGEEAVQTTRRKRSQPTYRAPRSKFRRFIWAYADRYQASDPQGRQALVEQFYIAFCYLAGRSGSHGKIDSDFRSRTNWPVGRKLIIVNSSGVAKIGPTLADRIRAPVRRLLDQQRHSKRRIIVAAFVDLGLAQKPVDRRHRSRSQIEYMGM